MLLYWLLSLAVICGKDDYIICDDRDHASIVDGRRLSFAKQLHYKHNDMEDLERVLQKLPYEAIKLIVVDGVFSMEGDLANLPAIVELKHKYNCSSTTALSWSMRLMVSVCSDVRVVVSAITSD